ncbi:hypothetical protein [Paenibacillus sp. NPDC093718]
MKLTFLGTGAVEGILPRSVTAGRARMPGKPADVTTGDGRAS